ncbi:MAG TPA: type II and III secretion system protein, partial [Thiotrichales bacterium]|nr:type II and III secretion system protein [Thiotrichales bacterium]
VGFVMSVTPQINGEDIVTLNVRPTISRVTGYVKDPNPTLAENEVESLVPLIQVRELDSILRVRSGQVAVLGGLIQDAADLNSQGLPMLSTLPGVGEAFALRNDKIRKTELVVFLRPRVVQLPSLQHELSDYQRYLPQNLPVTERKNLRSLMEKGT